MGELQILGHRICYRCEQEIMNTNVADDSYLRLVARLRNAWEEVMHVGENCARS